MKAELLPENGDPPIPITRDVTLVGRKGFCDLCLDHPTVSKRHGILVKTDGLLYVRDLATTNGTKVKGQRVRSAWLLPGDRMSFGGYKVKIYLGSDDAPSPSEQLAKQQAALAIGDFATPTPVTSRVVEVPPTRIPGEDDAPDIEIEVEPDDDSWAGAELPSSNGSESRHEPILIEVDTD